MKAAKYAVYAVLALLGLALAGIAVFALTFDPNRYKGDIERIVKERTGRTLRLTSDLAIAVYPSLGAKVGGASLSERGSDAQFLALDSAHASVALLPLLRGEVVVDKVRVAGLKALVVKDKDGRFNFQDLLEGGKPEKPAEAAEPPQEKGAGGKAVKFDIAGVEVERSALSYRDLASGQEFALDDLNLSVGRIAEKADGKLALSVHAKGNKPALDARVEIAAGYRFDLPAGAFALSGLDAKVTGAAAGLSDLRVDAKGDVAADRGKNEYRVSGLDVQFKGVRGKDALEAKLAAPSLVIAADSAKGEAVNAEFRLKGEKRSIEALMKLAGVQGSAKALAVPQFSADVAMSDPALPAKNIKIPVTGSLRANLEKQTAEADIKAKIDESNLQAKLGLAQFSPPAYRFDVAVDQFNLDRYVPPQKAASSEGGSQAPAAAPAAPINLSGLKGLDASGRLQVGALQARGLKLANLKAEMRAAGGRVEVAPHSADLYGGSLNGAIVVQADGNRVAVKEKLANIDIGPLLRDFAQQDRLEGRGNLVLDVTTAGPTVEAMKKALAGSARVELRDGAIKGIDVAGALRKAKAALGREPAQAASRTEKTDFSELSASFAIKNGVAHNEDLDIKAPLFRITGSGDIDIGNSRLDYTTKVAVVATSKGQGGADLAELNGLTVPLQLSGPFDKLAYRVDYAAVAAELAKSRAGEKLKERAEQQRGKIEERLGDKLKGLLGR